MKNDIKKQNELQALRVFNISKDALFHIEKLETELVVLKVTDPTIYQIIEGYKKEVDVLCKQYLDHLDQCTSDSIIVNPHIIDGFKSSTETIIKQLNKYVQKHSEDGKGDHLPDTSISNLLSPDFQL